MTIRAVVFDIGGVLEITPKLGITDQWEAKLGLQKGEIDQRAIEVWRGGSYGTITLEEVHQQLGEILEWSEETVVAFMEDTWTEYLGMLNAELKDYFQSLRPKYITAIISNSFVGAREREQALYGFEDITDAIIYSHEVGVAKPDPRIFEIAWEKLSVQPHEMIFLDDVEVIIDAARNLGIHGVHFKNNAQAIGEIQAHLEAE